MIILIKYGIAIAMSLTESQQHGAVQTSMEQGLGFLRPVSVLETQIFSRC